ncbi:MAG: substrate-binding domain-containing protein [Planctomycetota bacterium]|jgi:L-arabinose transport system substrate-binding protein|nr:substrate-binding domain-containing protein [Planctomycetota bacterium]
MSKIRLIALSLLAVFAVAVAMAGEKPKIGFLVKQPEEPWFQVEWKFADKAGEDLGFEAIKIGTPDGEKVLSAIDNIAANGAKGFVICTPDVRLGPGIMARARSHDLKVVTVDDRFIRADGSYMEEVPYVGMSATNIGRQMGEALMDEMKRRDWPIDEVRFMVITYEELDTTRERTDGAIAKAIEMGLPEDQVIKAPIIGMMEIPTSINAANVVLTRYPDVKYWLIGGSNDNSVLGAVRALEGKNHPVENAIAVGINGTDCIPELEKPNPTSFYGSILGLAGVEGYKTAEMAYKWAYLGEEPPLDTRTVGRLITRENFRQVLKEEGMD